MPDGIVKRECRFLLHSGKRFTTYDSLPLKEHSEVRFFDISEYFNRFSFIFFRSIRGFNNAVIFKTLKDADVTKMEDYAQQKLLKIVHLSLMDTERIEDICVHFFGEYSNEPTKFKFSSDEKELILRLARYTK